MHRHGGQPHAIPPVGPDRLYRRAVGQAGAAAIPPWPIAASRSRIDMLTTDPRYAFMFGNPNIEDTMVDILARLFRVPNDGRPHHRGRTLQRAGRRAGRGGAAAGAPDLRPARCGARASCRCFWCARKRIAISAPTTARAFSPLRQVLSRIAKEGRKYGVALALLTQRPSELDATILSQCSTILAMRLSTESDQKVMRANVHDSTFGILEYLPLLGRPRGHRAGPRRADAHAHQVLRTAARQPAGQGREAVSPSAGRRPT